MNCLIKNKTRDKGYAIYYPLIEEYFIKTLKYLDLNAEYCISLILVGPISIKRINNRYRSINKETDVISFATCDDLDPYEDKEAVKDLGDIFINLKRVKSQALEYGHSEKREFIFLFVHGLLHCLGYDHMTKEDEKLMFDIQKALLGDLR